MKLLIATIIFALTAQSSTFAAEEIDKKSQIEKPKQVRTEEVDISDLEQDYWRPNLDELEVVQNRRYQKTGRFEVAVQHGIYQGQDYVNSTSNGISVAYNISNTFFADFSYMRISNTDNDFLNSVRNQYGFTPAFNREVSQSTLSLGWTPIYAKFSLLGEKISHFEMYIAPGAGMTQTTTQHFTENLTIGEKFYITENLIFRIDWKMSRFTDHINTPQGASSIPRGGPGYVDQVETTNNIIFGLGWMF